MLHMGPLLYGVALPPQGGQEGVKGEALLEGGVYVLADEAGDRGPALPLCVPLGIVLSLALGLDDRQATLPAHSIGGLPDPPK